MTRKIDQRRKGPTRGAQKERFDEEEEEERGGGEDSRVRIPGITDTASMAVKPARNMNHWSFVQAAVRVPWTATPR